jgi:hypothetical protein
MVALWAREVPSQTPQPFGAVMKVSSLGMRITIVYVTHTVVVVLVNRLVVQVSIVPVLLELRSKRLKLMKCFVAFNLETSLT